MILATSIALAACNNTQVTEPRKRWDKEGEKHVFNITLADFVSGYEMMPSEPFGYYNSNGALMNTSNTEAIYSKDVAIVGEFSSKDEVKPISVRGTYTLTISPSADGIAYCNVETEQEMCVEYNKTNVTDSAILNEQSGALASQDKLDQFGMTPSDGTVILYSYNKSTVQFENTASQKPLKSSTTVNGFYIGAKHQNLTRYTVSTEYDYNGKRPIATTVVDNGEPVEYQFPKRSEGTFIDSNQILLYLRSLDKSSTSFQDSPSKSVFNPYTQSLQTAHFGLTYERNLILTDRSRDNAILATKLNLVTVMIGSNAFMVQENLPDSLAESKLDSISTLSDPVSKLTTARFRVGYLAYEIDYSSSQNTTDWNEIWTALSSSSQAN